MSRCSLKFSQKKLAYTHLPELVNFPKNNFLIPICLETWAPLSSNSRNTIQKNLGEKEKEKKRIKLTKASFIKHNGSQVLQFRFTEKIAKSLGKHLTWSLFPKKCQALALKLFKNKTAHRAFFREFNDCLWRVSLVLTMSLISQRIYEYSYRLHKDNCRRVAGAIALLLLERWRYPLKT